MGEHERDAAPKGNIIIDQIKMIEYKVWHRWKYVRIVPTEFELRLLDKKADTETTGAAHIEVIVQIICVLKITFTNMNILSLFNILRSDPPIDLAKWSIKVGPIQSVK